MKAILLVIVIATAFTGGILRAQHAARESSPKTAREPLTNRLGYADPITLEQAVADLNARGQRLSHHKPQPALTVAELETAIRSTSADALNITNEQYRAVRAICSTRMLPRYSYLLLVTNALAERSPQDSGKAWIMHVWVINLAIPLRYLGPPEVEDEGRVITIPVRLTYLESE